MTSHKHYVHAVINVEDVAYPIIQVPDLEAQEKFLISFGMVTNFKNANSLYMRGTDGDHTIYCAYKGSESKWIGTAFRAESREDLEKIAAHENVKVLKSEEPFGGYYCTFHDLDGNRVDIVHGQASVEPIEEGEHKFTQQYLVGKSNKGYNFGKKENFQRLGSARFVDSESVYGKMTRPHSSTPTPSKIRRFGHIVVNVSDFQKCSMWYKERLGFIDSDAITPPNDDGKVIGSFMRCNRKEEYTDHHTLALFGFAGEPGLNHMAYEVEDYDDLMKGHFHLEYLQEQDKKNNVEKPTSNGHAWGVARHILGSQIFDYWKDPHDFTFEHWTDGDQYKFSDGSRKSTIIDLLATQWGPTKIGSHL